MARPPRPLSDPLPIIAAVLDCYDRFRSQRATARALGIHRRRVRRILIAKHAWAPIAKTKRRRPGRRRKAPTRPSVVGSQSPAPTGVDRAFRLLKLAQEVCNDLDEGQTLAEIAIKRDRAYHGLYKQIREARKLYPELLPPIKRRTR